MAFELFNAIQAAKDEYNSGNATQANYDKLVAALEAFKNLSNNDSTIAMARYNVENLTEGDRIGEFPAAALQTYESAATALLAEYDGAESALSGAKIKEIIGGLKDAYATLYDNMVKPADKMWYVINTADEALLPQVAVILTLQAKVTATSSLRNILLPVTMNHGSIGHLRKTRTDVLFRRMLVTVASSVLTLAQESQTTTIVLFHGTHLSHLL